MKTIIAIALTLVVLSNADGANLSQRIKTSSGIVIHLPATWQQIPNDIMTAQVEEAARQNPNLPKQTFECGFQAFSDQWFSYPYLLIQISRTGRIPEVALEKMLNLDQIMGSKMSETVNAASSISEAAQGKTIYDSSNRILWTSALINYTGIGKIKILAGGHLSEDGFVQVFGYARNSDFAKYEALFHEIISNVELPEGIRYVPRAPETAQNNSLFRAVDWDKALSKAIAGAVLGGVAALILGLMKRKKKTSNKR